MTMNRSRAAWLIAILCLPLVAATNDDCGGQSTAEKQQRHATDQMTMQAERLHGMPNIVNFQERGLVKWLFELRDRKGLTTYTYTMDLNGRLHFLCESIGFGIPYSVQYTNPEKPMWRNSGSATVPQADPNGLYMPQGLSATFAICAGPDGEPMPVYVEPTIVVSPFPLVAASSYRLKLAESSE